MHTDRTADPSKFLREPVNIAVGVVVRGAGRSAIELRGADAGTPGRRTTYQNT
ncbi:hypothetical protein [Haloprofundus halobius]|uniref:hypothetical protein n=1 Tax=Haloprofundus halobius TaxID=2876194 RepID=UPI001CCD5E36|nr:hypothetical protein [Haloprofundus halobius]